MRLIYPRCRPIRLRSATGTLVRLCAMYQILFDEFMRLSGLAMAISIPDARAADQSAPTSFICGQGNGPVASL